MPVLVLSGDSELSKDRRVEEIRKKIGGDYLRVHPEDSGKIDLVSSNLKNIGMFGSRIVIDILDFDSWKAKEKKELLEMLKMVPEDIYVVIRSSKGIKGFKAESFPLPKPWERDRWMELTKKKFEKKGLKISREVLEYFLDVVGTDEYRIETEVEKLSLYSEGEVTAGDIDAVVYRSTHAGVDELCFAISERRVDDAHRTLPDVLKGADLLVLTASLAKHFEDLFRLRVAAKVKENYIWPDVAKYSKELGMPVPKVARFLGFKFKGWKNEPFNHITEYSVEDLANILKKLFILDRNVKMSENPIVHLHDFIESFRGGWGV